MLAFAFTLFSVFLFISPSSAGVFRKNQAQYARNARHHSLATRNTPRVLGAYFNDWSDTDLSTIPYSNFTELDYFVAVTTPSVNEVVFTGRWNEEPYIREFVDRAHAAGSTAIVTVGGWTGSVYFSKLVETPANRTAFAKTLAQLVWDYNFDGIDFDWEYPNNFGAGNYYAAEDTDNFLSLLQELRGLLGNGKRIVADVATSGFIGGSGVQIGDASAFAQVLDYVLVMAYDNSGSWTAETGPNAPLYSTAAPPDQWSSVEKAFQYWTSAGFPAQKIILGVPSYAKSFYLTSRTLQKTIYNGVTSFAYQTYATTDGDATMPYAQLVQQGFVNATGSVVKGNGFQRYWDSPSMTPFLFNPSTKQYITYDDPHSIAAKAQYVVSKGMGGIKFYDYQGLTGELYEAVKSVFKS